MREFVPGLELARAYWAEIVRPIVDAHVQVSDRAVALIGDGSDVLGYDTEQSTDHGWGPRLLVFVEDGFDDRRRRALEDRIEDAMPERFRGYPTRFAARDGDAPRHQVRMTTVARFFTSYLGFDPSGPIQVDHWLSTPSQRLLAVTAGAVFEDGPGGLSTARRRLSWYPDDVWLYLLGCQWRRLEQEEPFVGRCRQVGDDLGASVVAARLVRELIKLCFLIERQYAPYSKWLGTAFSRLRCAPSLAPLLSEGIGSAGPLLLAFEEIATRFNDLGLVTRQPATVRSFYERPFLVLASGRFADACLAATSLRRLHPVGSIDQVVDSTDVLSHPMRYEHFAAAFHEPQSHGPPQPHEPRQPQQ